MSNSKVKGVITGVAKTLHFYNLDACEDSAYQDEFAVKPQHYQKQRLVRGLVQTHFECEYHDVIFPIGSKTKAPLKYFEEQLKTKGPNDMVMVFYHGRSGGGGQDFSLNFSGPPKKDVDGYKFIKLFVDSGIDCFLIMDCQVPTRWPDKWIPSGGMVEIMARGDEMLRTDGKPDPTDEGNFTRMFCRSINALVRGIDIPAKQGGYLGWKEPRSIPELMAKCKEMSFNIRRVWFKKPVAGKDTFIARCVFDPVHIRETGKIHWFYKQIQGNMPVKKRKHDEIGEEEDPEDGGSVFSDGGNNLFVI